MEIFRRIVILPALVIALGLLGSGCSTAPIENTNQTETNEVKPPSKVQLKETPEAFAVEASLDLQYVNKEERIDMRYLSDVFELSEEASNPFRLTFQLKGDSGITVSNQSPITLERYTIDRYTSVKGWMDEHFKYPATNASPDFLFEVVDSLRGNDIVVFVDQPRKTRYLPLYDKETGDLLLLTVYHQDSRELLGIGNSMMLSLNMLPDLDYNATTDTSDWQTHRNEEYGFEVKYPKDFVIGNEEFRDGIFDLYIIAEESRNKDREVPGIHLFIYKNDQSLTPEEWIHRFDDTETYSQEEQSLGEYAGLQNAYRIIKKDLISETIFTMKDNYVYQMNIGHFDHQEIITVGNSIFQSLKFF